MYNTHHSLYSYLTSMPIFRVLISILCVTLLFTIQASHALAPNPGAVCDSNFAQGSFTSADYTNLVSALLKPMPYNWLHEISAIFISTPNMILFNRSCQES